MSQTNGRQGEPDYSQLNVYAGPELCDARNMTVYESAYFPLLGSDPGIHAKIIGSSHYIRLVGGLPQYNELTSCRPIMMAKDFDPVTHNYTIPEGIRTELSREVGPYDVTITIATVDFLTPIPENWDLWYAFGGEDGVPTAIRTHDSGWETYHGYDEYDVDVWTYTEFERRE